MVKEKTRPIYNKQLVLKEGKEHFMGLCKMYERLGQLFNMQSKALTHSMFAKSVVHQTQGRLLEQFREIGEEMKSVGTCLDLLGGKAVMTTPELKKKEKKEKKEIFVSNIQPKKPTIRACQDDIGDGFSPGEVGDGFVTDDEMDKMEKKPKKKKAKKKSKKKDKK